MSSVAIYEKDYPHLTFVVSDLGFFDTDSPTLPSSPFANWPIPSIALAKGTRLGVLDLSHFVPPPIFVDENCNVHNEFPESLRKPMEDLVDAFLYLGPPSLRLKEQLPADIALDIEYRMELQRRDALTGFPGAGTGRLKDVDRQIVNGAEDPLLGMHPPDLKAVAQNCLDRKSRGNTSHTEHSQ